MNNLTPQEIEEIVKAVSQPLPTQEERGKIPLRPPGTYKTIARVGLTPLEEKCSEIPSLPSHEDYSSFENLKTTVQVVFGTAHLSLKELTRLKEGSLLPLHALSEDHVEILINGNLVGRGEIVAVDGHFGVRIIDLKTKKS